MLFSLLTSLPTWLFFSSPQSMTATWRRWQCDSQNRDINNSQKEKYEFFTKMEIWAQSWKIILQKSFHFSQGVISSSESATNVKWSETTDLQKKRQLDAKLPSYQISKNYQTGIFYLICSLHISTTKWGETADLLLGQNDGWHLPACHFPDLLLVKMVEAPGWHLASLPFRSPAPWKWVTGSDSSHTSENTVIVTVGYGSQCNLSMNPITTSKKCLKSIFPAQKDFLPAGIELDHPGMLPPLQCWVEVVCIQDHHLESVGWK